ncbi:MAG: hypothetical protein AAFR58_25660, partial [Cyanobacteria bacterium J06627_28]
MEAKAVNEFWSFKVSYNLFYFLCAIIELNGWVLRRKYEGWLRTGFYFCAGLGFAAGCAGEGG